MRTVAISRRARGINALLQQARRQNLIVRSPDGHEFILAEVDDFNREIGLARQNKQLMALLNQRAKQTQTVPLNEVKKQLGLA
jgi:hypothetical protein